jgi:YbbR domain-containing protein
MSAESNGRLQRWAASAFDVDWKLAFRSNWRYKLSALLLVSLLWISLTGDQRQTRSVRTLLDVQLRDTTDWVLVDVPGDVQTTFQGKNRDLLSLFGDEPVLALVVDTVTGPSIRVALNTEQVSYDRDLPVRPTDVIPSSIELRFESRATKKVPVIADLEAVPAMGFTVLRPFLVRPESVSVTGAASEVESVGSVRTRRVTFDGLENTVVRDVPLELPGGVTHTRIEPPNVLVTVPVDSLVARSRRLPVQLIGSGSADLRVFPDSVEIVIRGASSAVELNFAEREMVTIVVDGAVSTSGRYAVEFEPIEGSFVTIMVEPPEVTVSAPGGSP